VDFPTDKDALISQLVPGLTFADVGGLWGLRNEMVSVALRAGARSGTMIDLYPADRQEWQDFRNRVHDAKLPEATCVVADATARNFPQRVGEFDVVHSAGVIYHIHSPFDYLMNLRDITRKILVVTSMTVPDRIGQTSDAIDLSGGKFLSTHQLDADQYRILSTHFETLNLDRNAILGAAKHLYGIDGHPDSGSWWWLFTVESLRRLLSAVGLQVDAVTETWHNRAHTFICTPSKRRKISPETTNAADDN